MTGGVPVWRELDHPRPLTGDERSALDALVRRTGSDRLSAQATTVRVGGACACGCSSVRLVTDGPPLSTGEMLRLEPEGRDYAAIETQAYDPAGRRVAVTLHLLDGLLYELEFFTAEGVATSWPLTWS